MFHRSFTLQSYVFGLVCFQLEEAAKEVADEVTRPRPVGEETVQDVQVMLKSDAHHASIRSLKVLSSPRDPAPPSLAHLTTVCRLPLSPCSPSRCPVW